MIITWPPPVLITEFPCSFSLTEAFIPPLLKYLFPLTIIGITYGNGPAPVRSGGGAVIGISGHRRLDVLRQLNTKQRRQTGSTPKNPTRKCLDSCFNCA